MIIVLNAGSSSLKVALFDAALVPVIDGQVTNIGGAGVMTLGSVKQNTTAHDHATALSLLLEALEQRGHAMSQMTAAAHRVVHGGKVLTAPTQLTPAVIDSINNCVPLAPLHNPASLGTIAALKARAPDLRQFASFDTAFHASNSAVAQRYAIPLKQHAAGIRRYGFHGLSYASMVSWFGDALPKRLLAFHLGNGASVCAILAGKSAATSMGYSPTSGLTMGTRSGDIDGAAVLRLAKELGIDEAGRLINDAAGLTGLAGDNNMKTLLERDDEGARFAVEHFCYWAARHAGSAVIAMGGLDAVAFTGGIGENAAPVRDRIMTHLACFGDVPVHVVAAEEEKQIARDAVALMAKGR